MVQPIEIEAINNNTTTSQIKLNTYVTGRAQGMFYDSKTQLIKFTD